MKNVDSAAFGSAKDLTRFYQGDRYDSSFFRCIYPVHNGVCGTVRRRVDKMRTHIRHKHLGFIYRCKFLC